MKRTMQGLIMASILMVGAIGIASAMTAEQIGLSMGMNKNSVDQLLYRAKLKLKLELELEKRKGESHEIK